MNNRHKYKYLTLIVLVLFTNMLAISQTKIEIDSTFLYAGIFPKNHLVTHKIGIDYVEGERKTIYFAEDNSGFNIKSKIICQQPQCIIGIKKNERTFIDIMFVTSNTEGNHNTFIKISSIRDVDTTIVIKINYTISSEDSKYNFNKINLEKQGNDSIKVTMTGLFQTDGGCHKAYPLLWIERYQNNNWNYYSGNNIPVDCGAQNILFKNESFYIKKSDYKLESGTYRLVVHPKHKKRMHSKSFFISANNN